MLYHCHQQQLKVDEYYVDHPAELDTFDVVAPDLISEKGDEHITVFPHRSPPKRIPGKQLDSVSLTKTTSGVIQVSPLITLVTSKTRYQVYFSFLEGPS